MIFIFFSLYFMDIFFILIFYLMFIFGVIDINMYFIVFWLLFLMLIFKVLCILIKKILIKRINNYFITYHILYTNIYIIGQNYNTSKKIETLSCLEKTKELLETDISLLNSKKIYVLKTHKGFLDRISKNKNAKILWCKYVNDKDLISMQNQIYGCSKK